VAVDPDYLSIPEPIVFFPPVAARKVAYALLLSPQKNRGLLFAPCWRKATPAGEKPRRAHRGDGSRAQPGDPILDQSGIAVLDVNYRGSSGYGRAYRDALKGRWGLVDVEDCIAGAQFLAEQGKVDGNGCSFKGAALAAIPRWRP
jgi:hypothetical protein